MTAEPNGARRRRLPEETRQLALAAARRLLLEQGPRAVTLQAVATALGMRHGTITHHFGSSAALHAALVEAMIAPFIAQAPEVATSLRMGVTEPAEIAARTFAAFDEGGLGMLVAWMVVTGELGRLAGLFAMIQQVVATLRAGEPPETDRAARGAGVIVAGLISAALGAALVGGPVEQAAALPAGTLRTMAAAQLASLRA